MIRSSVLTLTAALVTVLTLSVLLPQFLSLAKAHAVATDVTINNSIKMTKQQSFVDSSGRLNVIGVVDNNGKIPVAVTVSLNAINNNAKFDVNSATTTTNNMMMTDPTYGNVIYPFTGAPFKFVIAPNQSVKGMAFISSIKQVPVPYYNVIRLNYSNMPAAASSSKAMVGTAKNIGPFDLHDVSVYASAHDRNGIQIDSVKSNVMHLIKPGQEARFIALPDFTTAPHIFYYSCAGMSLGNDPMTTLDIGKGQSILYDIRGVVRISDFKYSADNDSIIFAAKHYNPDGGPIALKLVKNSGNPAAISVMMDGKVYNNNSNNNSALYVKMLDPKTVHIDLFIPPGDHALQIKGIRNAA